MPMLVTLDGMIIDVKPQTENAPRSMFVTLLGRETDVRLSQPLNATWPIVVTPLGMMIDARFLQYTKVA